MKTSSHIYADDKAFDEAAKAGPISHSDMRRAELARRAVHMLTAKLEQLDAVNARHSVKVQVRVCGADVSTCGDWVEICRTLSRALFRECKYWQFHAERLVKLDKSLAATMQRVYLDAHEFAEVDG